MKQNEQLENALKHMIENEGMDESTIREQIAFAISLALKSNDPNLQNFWTKIPCNGSCPTIDEIVDYLITEITNTYK